LEKSRINFEQVQQFGLATGQTVYVFGYPPVHTPTTDGKIRNLTAEQLQHVYHTNYETVGMFCQGAPMYLTAPIAPCRGLPNSKKGFLHSMTFDPDEPNAKLLAATIQLIRDTAGHGGTLVWLPLVPITINVTIPDIPIEAFDAAASIDTNTTVVPVSLSTPFDADKIHILGNSVVPNVYIKFQRHPYELGFSSTFHKVEGRTEARMIVDINDRPTSPKIDMSKLYVSASRVRLGDHLAVLPKHPSMSFDYLQYKLHDPHLLLYMHGFDPVTRLWDPTRTRHMADLLTDEITFASMLITNTFPEPPVCTIDGRNKPAPILGLYKRNTSASSTLRHPPSHPVMPKPSLPLRGCDASATHPSIPRITRTTTQDRFITGWILVQDPAIAGTVHSGINNTGNNCFIISAIQVSIHGAIMMVFCRLQSSSLSPDPPPHSGTITCSPQSRRNPCISNCSTRSTSSCWSRYTHSTNHAIIDTACQLDVHWRGHIPDFRHPTPQNW
jgi:hypothetical protein